MIPPKSAQDRYRILFLLCPLNFLTIFFVLVQYMSAVFYHTEEQKRLAEESLKAVQQKMPKPIQTQILKAGAFYVAEEYETHF